MWGAIVLWSASSWFVRAGHANALVFTTWRLWFALPPLAVVVGIRAARGAGVPRRPAGVPLGRWILLLLGGGFFFSTGATTAFASINQTRLLDVTLIGALQPVVIVAVAVLFLGERTTRGVLAWGGVAVAGTVFVACTGGGAGEWSLQGELLAVASLAFNSGWFLYSRVLRDKFAVDPFVFVFAVFAASAVMLTPIAAISAGSLALPAAALGFAALTMCSGTTAHVLMVWAHRYVSPSVSAPLLLAEPPLVALGAWWFFGEVPTPPQIVGSAVVVVALWGVVRSPALVHVEEEIPDLAPAT
jgi:drug/metabolite transporter (DMT)-like permease